ncbi:YvcK family protein [Weissella diestrammenae]|uniref:Putative gluconeogenesis factor n=1 Tax=Weissella diestrammenae TaxID=1162633 RepID=A0A7G9T3N6_9LACO|nr:gluconeogenesis factor YvcK family protein [Weissella diestrammenae]MCM0582691.1 YvcK family protein [Weissella diestrammenae]QNN74711.1 YvcK family protein [Weissella diestrammenae]
MSEAIKAQPISDKIVVIGGGTGQSVILGGLRKYDTDLTAIITVADDGGSSGTLRDYLKMVPPGDIRNVMATLSDAPQDFLDLFQYRFTDEASFLANHTIGNLMIAAMAEQYKDIFEAVQYLSKIMQVKGHIYPVVNEPLTLHARFTDGTCLSGEAEITQAHKKITNIWVENAAGEAPEATAEVVNSILAADMVVLGPGSLYTSILPNISVPNIAAALRATTAKIVYISNIMTQKGETDDFSDGDHLRVINQQIGREVVDAMIMNSGVVPEGYIDWQRWNEISHQVKSDPEEVKKQGATPVLADLVELRDDGAFHNATKVAELLQMIASDNTIKNLKD